MNFGLLDRILGKDNLYSRNQYKYIIGLMKEFELCYDINDEIIMPQLFGELTESEEELLKGIYKGNNVFFETSINYDYAPKSIFPRLIVRMYNDVKYGLRWNTGVVFESRELNSIAIIRFINNKIKIEILSENKKEYLLVILYHLYEINKSFKIIGNALSLKVTNFDVSKKTLDSLKKLLHTKNLRNNEVDNNINIYIDSLQIGVIGDYNVVKDNKFNQNK